MAKEMAYSTPLEFRKSFMSMFLIVIKGDHLCIEQSMWGDDKVFYVDTNTTLNIAKCLSNVMKYCYYTDKHE